MVGLVPYTTELEGLQPQVDKPETRVGEMPNWVGSMHTWTQEMQTDVHEMKALKHSIDDKVKEMKALTDLAKTDPEYLRKKYGSVEEGLKEMLKQSAAMEKTIKTQMGGVEHRARERNKQVNSEVQRMQKTVEEAEKKLGRTWT